MDGEQPDENKLYVAINGHVVLFPGHYWMEAKERENTLIHLMFPEHKDDSVRRLLRTLLLTRKEIEVLFHLEEVIRMTGRVVSVHCYKETILDVLFVGTIK